MANVNINYQEKGYEKVRKGLEETTKSIDSLIRKIRDSKNNFSTLNKNVEDGAKHFKDLGVNIKTTNTAMEKAVKVGGTLFAVLDFSQLASTSKSAFTTIAGGLTSVSLAASGAATALQLMQANGIDPSFISNINLLTTALSGNIAASKEFSIVAVAAYNDFQSSLTRVNTILNANSAALENNGNQIQKLVTEDLKNAVSSTEALAAQYEVLSGGFSSAAESQKVMTAALKLATAGEAEAGQVTRLLVSTMRAYSSSAEDAAKTAGILNGVVEQGITTVYELSQGFGQAAGVARQAGLSITELGGAVAVLTTKGIRTPIALTSLQSLFNIIIDKTPQAEEALAKLRDSAGKPIRFDAAEIKAKGFSKALADLNKAIGGNAQKLAEIIPEAEAYRAALALMANGAKDLEKVTISLGEKTADSLDKVFGISLNNNRAKFVSTINQFGESLVDFGKRISPALEQGVASLSKLVEFVSNLPEPVKKGIVSFISFQLALGKVNDVAGSVIGTVVKLIAIFAAAKLANEVLSGRIGSLVQNFKDLYKSQAGVAAIVKQATATDQTYIAVLKNEEIAARKLVEINKELTDSAIKRRVKDESKTLKNEQKAVEELAKYYSELGIRKTKLELKSEAKTLKEETKAVEFLTKKYEVLREKAVQQDIRKQVPRLKQEENAVKLLTQYYALLNQQVDKDVIRNEAKELKNEQKAVEFLTKYYRALYTESSKEATRDTVAKLDTEENKVKYLTNLYKLLNKEVSEEQIRKEAQQLDTEAKKLNKVIELEKELRGEIIRTNAVDRAKEGINRKEALDITERLRQRSGERATAVTSTGDTFAYTNNVLNNRVIVPLRKLASEIVNERNTFFSAISGSLNRSNRTVSGAERFSEDPTKQKEILAAKSKQLGDLVFNQAAVKDADGKITNYSQAVRKANRAVGELELSQRRLTIGTYAVSRASNVASGGITAIGVAARGTSGILKGLVSLIGSQMVLALGAAAGGFLVMQSNQYKAGTAARDTTNSLKDLNTTLKDQDDLIRQTTDNWNEYGKAIDENASKEGNKPKRNIIQQALDGVEKYFKNLDESQGYQNPNAEGLTPEERRKIQEENVKNYKKRKELDSRKGFAEGLGDLIEKFTTKPFQVEAEKEFNSTIKNVEIATKKYEEYYKTIATGDAVTQAGSTKLRQGLQLTTDDLIEERKQVESVIQKTEESIQATENSLAKLRKELEAAKNSGDTKRQDTLQSEINLIIKYRDQLQKLVEDSKKLADQREQFFVGQSALTNNLFGDQRDLVTKDQIDTAQQKLTKFRKEAVDNFSKLGLDIEEIAKKAGKTQEEVFNDVLTSTKSGTTNLVTSLKAVGVESSDALNLNSKAALDIQIALTKADPTKTEDLKKVQEALDSAGIASNQTKESLQNLITTFKTKDKSNESAISEAKNAIGEFEASRQNVDDLTRKSKILKPEDIGLSRVQNLAKSQIRLADESFKEYKKKYEEFISLTDEQRKKLTKEQAKEFSSVLGNSQVEATKLITDRLNALDQAFDKGAISSKEYADALQDVVTNSTLGGKQILNATDYLDLLTRALNASTEALKRQLELLAKREQLVANTKFNLLTKQTNELERQNTLLESQQSLQQTLNEGEITLLSNKSSLTKDAVKQAELEVEIKTKSLSNLAKTQQFELKSLEIKQKLTKIEDQRKIIELQLSELESKRSVRLALDALNVAKSRGSKEEISEAKVSLGLAKEQLNSSKEALGNYKELVNTRKTLFKQEEQSIKVRQASDRDTASTELAIANNNKIIAQYEKQIRLLTQRSEVLQQSFDPLLRALDGYTTALSNQQTYLQKVVEYRNKEVDSLQRANSIISNFTQNSYLQNKLAVDGANLKLKSLMSQKNLELQIFELQQRQAEIAEKRLLIENKISTAKLTSELKIAQLELEKLKRTKASQEDIEAQKLVVGAKQEELIGSKFNQQLLEASQVQNRQLRDLERRSFFREQNLSILEAKAEKASATKYNFRDDFAVKREARNFIANNSNPTSIPKLDIRIPDFEQFRKSELQVAGINNVEDNTKSISNTLEKIATKLLTPLTNTETTPTKNNSNSNSTSNSRVSGGVLNAEEFIQAFPQTRATYDLFFKKQANNLDGFVKQFPNTLDSYRTFLNPQPNPIKPNTSTNTNIDKKEMSVKLEVSHDFKNVPKDTNVTELTQDLNGEMRQLLKEVFTEVNRLNN